MCYQKLNGEYHGDLVPLQKPEKVLLSTTTTTTTNNNGPVLLAITTQLYYNCQ